MGKFIISDAKNGFKFNLVASNGETIASSQIYSAKATAKKGIESVIKNCSSPVENQTVANFEQEKNPKFEIYKDKKGEFRFRLKSSNGQIVAVGEGYANLAGVQNGIKSIQKNAPKAQIVDQTSSARSSDK